MRDFFNSSFSLWVYLRLPCRLWHGWRALAWTCPCCHTAGGMRWVYVEDGGVEALLYLLECILYFFERRENFRLESNPSKQNHRKGHDTRYSVVGNVQIPRSMNVPRPCFTNSSCQCHVAVRHYFHTLVSPASNADGGQLRVQYVRGKDNGDRKKTIVCDTLASVKIAFVRPLSTMGGCTSESQALCRMNKECQQFIARAQERVGNGASVHRLCYEGLAGVHLV